MNTSNESKAKIPSRWDVIVVGGGVSGCMAAIAAARQGAKTLLVERYGFLGGTLTNAGVGPMMTFHAGSRQVITGLPQELIDRLCSIGGCIGHIEDTTGYASSVTPFDAEKLKLVLDEMMAEGGVEVLFHAVLTGVRKQGKKLNAVCVQTKGGLLELAGEVFIDATGDADLSFNAGAEVHQGRTSDGLCQPMTSNFRIRGVDVEAFKEEIRRHPDNFNIGNLSSMERSARLSVAGFYKEFNAAKAAGEISTQREDVLMFETIFSGEFIVNTTRIIKLNPVEPWDLSRAEAEGRRQVHQLMKFFRKYCKGFENAELISTGVQIGVRESRRVMGEYVLTKEDLLSSHLFEDTVAVGGYPIDIHNPVGAKTATTHLKPGQIYYIPLRALIVRGIENLLVCGRCISATHEACAAIRVTPIAMGIGQAAGTAAGMSAASSLSLRELSPALVQRALENLGAVIR